MKGAGDWICLFLFLLAIQFAIASPGLEDSPINRARTKRYIGYKRSSSSFETPHALPLYYNRNFDESSQAPSSNFRERNREEGLMLATGPEMKYMKETPRLQRRFNNYPHEERTMNNMSPLDRQINQLSDAELLLLLKAYMMNNQGLQLQEQQQQLRQPGWEEYPIPTSNNNELLLNEYLYQQALNNPGLAPGKNLNKEQEEPLLFLKSKRTKRIDINSLRGEGNVIRSKKNADGGMSKLQSFFNNGNNGTKGRASNNDKEISSSISTATNSKGDKAKKSIDWSNYFGIDKKSGGGGERYNPSVLSHGERQMNKGDMGDDAVESEQVIKNGNVNINNNENVAKSRKSGLRSSKDPVLRKEMKANEKLKEREENETEEKSDRKWILREFYKNLAMATNVRRKREVEKNDLGDSSLQGLARTKKEIIKKLEKAYSIKKLRQDLKEMRDALKN